MYTFVATKNIYISKYLPSLQNILSSKAMAIFIIIEFSINNYNNEI